MSTHRRQGHFRRGPNGQQVWVQPHDVTRSGGSTNSYTPSPRPTIRIGNAAVPSVPRVSRPKSTLWVEPNARCPVCGAAVYFYKNEAGSRVYFDEVGPPWPKHPCIDIPFYTRPSAEFEGQLVAPSPRLPSTRGSKTTLSRRQRSDERDQSSSSRAFQAFTVQGTEARKDKTLIQLAPVSGHGPGRTLHVNGSRTVPEGQLVFLSGLSISYFDVARMSVTQFPVGAIAESTSVPKPPREDLVSKPMSQNSSPTPLTLRKDPVPRPVRPGRESASAPPQKTKASPVRKEVVAGEGADSQGSAGCGLSLLLFFLIILLWLIFGFWGAGNHSFFGVVGGLVMTLITAIGLMLGFTMHVGEKKELGQGKRRRPEHVAATPSSLHDPYSLFREE